MLPLLKKNYRLLRSGYLRLHRFPPRLSRHGRGLGTPIADRELRLERPATEHSTILLLTSKPALHDIYRRTS
jgi:hypothetical protein